MNFKIQYFLIYFVVVVALIELLDYAFPLMASGLKDALHILIIVVGAMELVTIQSTNEKSFFLKEVGIRANCVFLLVIGVLSAGILVIVDQHLYPITTVIPGWIVSGLLYLVIAQVAAFAFNRYNKAKK